MHLLYFWRGDVYRRDLQSWDHFHLNQNSRRMRDVAPGEHLWAFTRNTWGHYALAADLVVSRKVQNPAGSRYGKYRVYGDQRLSRYFAVEDAPEVEGLLRVIAHAKTAALGQSFQGPGAVRGIGEEAHQALLVFAQDLPLEPLIHGPGHQPYQYRLPSTRPSLLNDAAPEGAPPLEDRLLMLPPGVGDLPTPAMSAERREHLIRRQLQRDHSLVSRLQDLYDGRCQLCLWQPQATYTRRLCEGHHIHWLSLGGADHLENMMLVCPNHHRAIHAGEAQLDYGCLEMDFGSHREPVRLNDHLPVNI